MDKNSIQIYYVSSLKKCFIELKENFHVDFRSNLEFGKLIGFNSLVISSTCGSLTSNITNSVDNIVIRASSIIRSSNYNGFQNDSVLYMFSTRNYHIGYT